MMKSRTVHFDTANRTRRTIYRTGHPAGQTAQSLYTSAFIGNHHGSNQLGLQQGVPRVEHFIAYLGAREPRLLQGRPKKQCFENVVAA